MGDRFSVVFARSVTLCNILEMITSTVVGEEAETFDCNHELDQWETKWGNAKKDWCCRYEAKGCEVAAIILL